MYTFIWKGHGMILHMRIFQKVLLYTKYNIIDEAYPYLVNSILSGSIRYIERAESIKKWPTKRTQ